MFEDYPDVVSVEDLQTMLHISRNAAYGLLKAGTIATIRIGKKYIIPKANVIDFLNGNTKSAIITPSGKACASRKRGT